jgi:anti-anti-sigma regulatory factor
VKKQGGALNLVNLEKRVHGILQMTKLLTVFEVFENEQAAVALYTK